MRKCEICGHDDSNGRVVSSSIGAMSFYYCATCLALGAEHRVLLDVVGKDVIREGYTYYDEKDDCYRDYKTDAVYPIRLKSGEVFLKRANCIKFLEGVA